MKRFQCLSLPVVLVFLLTLAACGSSSANTSGNGDGNTSSSATPTTVASTTGNALRTASATVGGKAVTLLMNEEGMTLYYFMPDTLTTAACTGGCASTWPPDLSYDSSVPTSATALSGQLTVQTNANGHQVEYNGHPLYSYSGDTKPGQTNGEGIGNQWFVATTDLAMNNGGAKATPTSSSYQSGY